MASGRRLTRLCACEVCGCLSLLATNRPTRKPSVEPTNTSEGKCSPPVTRVVATAVAMLYIANCTGHLGHSWATTEAIVQANAEWPEGKEPLLKLPAKNFPSPLPM